MKKYVEVIFSVVVSFVLGYLAVAFVNANLDIAQWSEFSRINALIFAAMMFFPILAYLLRQD